MNPNGKPIGRTIRQILAGAEAEGRPITYLDAIRYVPSLSNSSAPVHLGRCVEYGFLVVDTSARPREYQLVSDWRVLVEMSTPARAAHNRARRKVPAPRSFQLNAFLGVAA